MLYLTMPPLKSKWYGRLRGKEKIQLTEFYINAIQFPINSFRSALLRLSSDIAWDTAAYDLNCL
jgi:hypothetical protein